MFLTLAEVISTSLFKFREVILLQRIRTLSLILIVALVVQCLSVMTAAAAPKGPEVHALAGAAGPQLVSASPNGGATGVVPNTSLKLTFDEEIIPGSGSIELYKVGVATAIGIYDVTNVAVVQRDDANKSIVIQPGGLTDGSYYVIVPASAILSYASGLPYVGLSAMQWSFTVLQLVPVAYNFIPSNSPNMVDPGAPGNLSLDFTRQIAKGMGYIQVKRTTDNFTVQSIDIASAEVIISPSGLTMSAPLRGLEYNTAYTILIDPGALKDAGNGGAFGGISAGSWNFATKPALDTTKPKVVTFDPVNNGTLGSLTPGVISIKFDEKVFASPNKSLVIRNAVTNNLVCTVTATDNGTDQIVANLAASYCPAFVNNTDYTVTIGPDVYRDASGNYFEGVIWKFKALVDVTPPVITAYSPAVASISNSISTTDFSLIFNKPITLVGTPKAYIFPQNSPTARRELTMTVDPTNNTRILFKLVGTAKLSNSATYSISIPENVIADLVPVKPNLFAGISNPYQWTFQTGTNSTPVINTATIDGVSIALTYSENLDSSKIPSPSNFYVTVNGVVTAVMGVNITGKEVRLSLQYPVLIGQAVQVSYYQDSSVPARRLQNASGVEAASFNNQVVKNTTDSTLPKPVSGMFYGNTLTLTLDRTIPLLPTGAQNQFIVKQSGNTIAISTAVLNGTNLYLTLSSNSTSPDPVSITYTPGANPLRDQAGNLVPAFTDLYVRNVYDNAPPSLVSAVLNGNKILLTYNEGLNTVSIPLKNSYSIVASGNTTTLPSITTVAVVNNTVELTLSSSVAANVPVLLYYYPSNPAVVDLSGNAAPAIVSHSFTTGSASVAKLSTQNINNNQIALSYTSTMNTSSIPYATQFSVKYDGVTVPVTVVSVSGTQVILTLASNVGSGQRVTVSYNSTGVPLKDSLNQAVSVFSDLVVTNMNGAGNPTTVSNLPEYLESDGAGGLRFISDKASTAVSAATSTGRTVNRYMVNGDKLLVAYNSVKQGSGVTVPMVTFKVPATEAAALVGIPLRTIMDAASKFSNASFRLEYGDMQFTIPLKAINYNKQLQSTGGDLSSAYLLLNIEKVDNSPLVTTLRGRGAQTLATPAKFTASLLAGGKEREIDAYDMDINRTFVLSSAYAANSSGIAVVRIDNDSGETTYVPSQVNNSGSDVRVVFKHKGNSTYAPISYSAIFSDMNTHWAKNDVLALASRFIVRGPSLTTFAPGTDITRSDFAEYIARGLGLNGASASASKFKDVGASFKTASYIGAVSDAGIVQGGTDGKFRPNASITREEMATMLVRAMKFAGVQKTASSSALNGFKDKSKVSSWAKDGVATSVEVGFIKGSTASTISPQSNATRAEAAIMIKRLLEYVEYL